MYVRTATCRLIVARVWAAGDGGSGILCSVSHGLCCWRCRCWVLQPETSGYIAITRPIRKEKALEMGRWMLDRSRYEALRTSSGGAGAATMAPASQASAAGVGVDGVDGQGLAAGAAADS